MKLQIIVILLAIAGITTGVAQLGDEFVNIVVTPEGKTKVSQTLFPETFVATIDVHVISENISKLLAKDEQNLLLGTTQNQDLLKIATLGASVVDLKYEADILTYKSGVFKLQYDSETESRVSLPPLSKLVSLNTIPIEITDDQYLLPPGDISLSFTVKQVTSKEFFVPVGNSELKVEAITAAKIEDFSANPDEIQFIIRDKAIVLTIIPKQVMNNPNDALLNGEEVDFSLFHQNATHSWVRIDPHEKGLVKILDTNPKFEEGGGCLIATAAFGSELAPKVQFLREIRDNQLMKSESGASFMTGFNQIYYSFSPYIADYQRENPVFKEIVKIGITPLLSSLSVMKFADSEHEIIGLGISVILMNIGMYFILPFVIFYQGMRILRTRGTNKANWFDISSCYVQNAVKNRHFGIITLLVLSVSLSSALVQPAYAEGEESIRMILDITYANIQESFEDADLDPLSDPIFAAAQEEYEEAIAALEAGDLVAAEENALSAMALFEESAENIGELEGQQATIQPLGLGTAASSIFNVQEEITNSGNEANELRELAEINNFDNVDFSAYDESVDLAKTLLADGSVPDAQAQLALANQIKDDLYQQIEDAANENSVENIEDYLEDQTNLGLTLKDIRELETILEDITTDEEAPGNSGDAPGQNNEDGPGNSGDAPGQNNEDGPGNSGDAPGQNDVESPEDLPGFGAASESASEQGLANGQGLGIGKVPPGLAKLFGLENNGADDGEAPEGLPPGLGAAGDNPSPNAQGQGLGLGEIPPGFLISFNERPDDYFENHYEATVDDFFEATYDGTNRGHADGKGLFGAFPGKSGEAKSIIVNEDKGRKCTVTKGITDEDPTYTSIIGYTPYTVEDFTAIGLGCNDVSDIIRLNVIAPNGTNISTASGLPNVFDKFQGYSFTPDVNGDWIINLVVQVFTESRTVTVTGTNDAPTANSVLVPNAPLTIGVPSTLDSTGSTDDGTIVDYSWTRTDTNPGAPLTIVNDPATPTATIEATNLGQSGNTYEYTLTVTDDKGAKDSFAITITVS